MIKVTLWISFLAVASYALFCFMLYVKQRTLIYYPTFTARSNEAEVLWLKNDGQTLKVWNVYGDSGTALIYFGGNAEDVAQNLPSFKQLFPNFSLFLLNYRGYGGSSGQPSETALFSDARMLYQEVVKTHDTIVVMGRSLGSGVAVYLTSHEKVDKLILTTPFDSMTRLASAYYPFIPVSRLLKDRYESVSYASAIDNPTLVLIAEKDEVIPRANSDALVAMLDPALLTVQVIDRTGHNDIESNQEYEKSIKAFISL